MHELFPKYDEKVVNQTITNASNLIRELQGSKPEVLKQHRVQIEKLCWNLVQAGMMCVAPGKEGKYLQVLSTQLKLARTTQYLQFEAATLMLLGDLFERIYQFDKAKACFKRCHKINQSTGNRPGEAQAIEKITSLERRLHGIGQMHHTFIPVSKLDIDALIFDEKIPRSWIDYSSLPREDTTSPASSKPQHPISSSTPGQTPESLTEKERLFANLELALSQRSSTKPLIAYIKIQVEQGKVNKVIRKIKGMKNIERIDRALKPLVLLVYCRIDSKETLLKILNDISKIKGIDHNEPFPIDIGERGSWFS